MSSRRSRGLREDSIDPIPVAFEPLMATALERQDFADSAAAAILHGLGEAGLRKGDVIPPVTRLAAEFDVSRTIVREALGKLADRGHIERGKGRRWILAKHERAGVRRTRSAGIAHSSLAAQAASAVLELIRKQGLKEGDALPSSRDLAERFEVSVLVMREALADLSARGILRRRQGRESVVALPSAELISSIMNFRAYVEGIGVDEFQLCRQALEITAAELAASHPDRAERRRKLEPPLRGMREAHTEADFNQYDVDFHRGIAELSGNAAAALLLASLNDLVRMSMDVAYRRVRDRFGPEGIRIAVENHARIADAIAKGDARRAGRAMEEHFTYILPTEGKAR